MKITTRLFITGLAIALSALSVQAQDYSDLGALFSQTTPGGSARIQALGGAQIGLGGDISSAYSNPAGLGMFNRSTFSLSTGLSFINNGSSYYGNNNSDLKLNVNIPNFGIVLQKDGKNNIKSHSFGLSFNRIADYQNRLVYGAYSNTSMIDDFIQNANGTDESEFFNQSSAAYNSLEGLAVRTDIILAEHYLFDNNVYNYYDSDILGFPYQKETVDTRGAQYQFNLGYGMNYNDMLFLGANIGIKSINYSLETTYTESGFKYTPSTPSDTYTNPLNSFRLRENLDIDGNGVSTTLGLIYRPVNFIQIGSSFTSPSYISLNEEFSRDLRADYINYDDEFAESDLILSTYTLTTPMTLSGGITFFAGRLGFLTADLEMIDYGKGRLNSNDFSTSGDNNSIRADYEKVYNMRFGAEARINDHLMLRGGYSMANNGAEVETQSFTGGAGLRYKHVSMDIAVINSLKNYDYFYNSGVNIFQNTTKVITTLGVYF